MLSIRVIPCLDVEDGRVVKGVKFKEIKDAGDPVVMAKDYSKSGADEITFLDIGATYKSKQTLLGVVHKVSKQVFVPLTVGGGIRTIEDIQKTLRSGADKVSICSAALDNPELISQGANIFGSQCIVVSVDAKRVGNSWHCFASGGRRDTGVDALEWISRVVGLGAGEILLNSIDADGTKKGYDLLLTKTVSELVKVPVIASGGAGTLEHLAQAVFVGKADALLLASLLHYKELTIEQIKRFLAQQKINVRL